jgi:Flp pilus assembly protein TadD
VHADGVRFDVDIDYFDDWDFWLQCSRHTPFLRVPGLTAIYRAYLSQSGVDKVDTGGAEPRVYRDRDTVAARYAVERERARLQHERDRADAMAATQRRDLGAALAMWQVVYAGEPLDVDATNHLAEACFSAGRLDAARDILSRGVERNPREATYLVNLAMVLDAQGRHDAARDARTHAARLDPALAHVNPPDLPR